MESERTQRVMDLYLDACELAPGDQTTFLQDRCGTDDALREEVAALLRARTDEPDFLAEPIFCVGAELLADAAAGTLRPGDRLGDCVVESLLGIGGMGEVYLARDRVLGRPVAVKLIQRGRGSDLLRHFRHERQVLAGLNHPHIARLYGGAVTPTGQAYLVMEYVEGEGLDVYCRERCLSVADRLVLFRKVCAAVSHAHQHLVVHRDIKPANIRVTPEGEPKLLDFGIAKLLDPTMEGNDRHTMTQLGAMTRSYASPEQLRGESVTTATDIYTLGVVLYELLCGILPFDPKHRDADQTAPRPGSVAFTTDIARERGTTPARLGRQLAGDLDNIVQLAMRPEPARRYPSVSQFSDDLRRHLEAQPVTARKETLRYVAAKFVTRNRALAVAASLALLALIGGIAATGWQAHRADVQRRLADAQRLKAERRFEDVRHLADSLMGEIHDSVQDLAGATPTRKLIVSRALEYLDNLSQDADTPALRLDLAAAYRKIGDVQGNPYGSNLGDTDGALASYRKAENLLISPPDAKAGGTETARLELGRTERALGDMAELRGDFAEMTRRYRQSLEIFSHLAREQPSDPTALDELARAYDTLGNGLNRTENGHAEQLACYAQALAGRQKLVVQFPGNVKYRRGLAVAFMKLGRTTLSDPAHGVADITRGAALMKTLAEENPDSAGLQNTYVMMLYYLGVAQADTGDHAGALASFAQVLPIREQLAAADPKNNQARFDVAAAHGQLAEALTATGQPEQALDHARQAVAGMNTLMTADLSNVMYLRNSILTHRQLAAAHMALAAQESLDKPNRVAHWSEARLACERARERFNALKAKGGVRTEDADMLGRLAADTAKCDQGLARLRDQ